VGSRLVALLVLKIKHDVIGLPSSWWSFEL